jgi:hypothetical protein
MSLSSLSSCPRASKHWRKKANWNLPRLIFVLSALWSSSKPYISSFLASSLYVTSCLVMMLRSTTRACLSCFVIHGWPSSCPERDTQARWVEKAFSLSNFFVPNSSYIRKKIHLSRNWLTCEFLCFVVPKPLESNFKDKASWGAEAQN